MPFMTQAASRDCDVLPQRYESIVNQIVAALGGSGRVSDVVVTSFSSCISYSHRFRRRAGLGGELTGVIDLDGIVSSFSSFCTSLTEPAGRVIRIQQSGVASASQLGRLAAQNTFPLPRPRWGGPFATLFSANPKQALLQIHGTVPQTMMFTASKRAG